MGNNLSAEPGLELSGHRKAVYACCVSQDGQLLLSASADGSLRLWDLKQLCCIRQFLGEKLADDACRRRVRIPLCPLFL